VSSNGKQTVFHLSGPAAVFLDFHNSAARNFEPQNTRTILPDPGESAEQPVFIVNINLTVFAPPVKIKRAGSRLYSKGFRDEQGFHKEGGVYFVIPAKEMWNSNFYDRPH
jgi:hypothetical protein